MSEADDLAAKYGIGASPAPADNGADALAAKYGIETPRSDMGPESRRALSHLNMPTAKSDEELGLDEGPKFYRGEPAPNFIQRRIGHADTSGILGNIVSRAEDAPGTDAYRVAHVGGEMSDPGAQMITAGAMAAPLAVGAAALAPKAISTMVGGGVSGGSQAAMQGGDPVTGAFLGMIPGAGRAASAVDQAIGEAAFNKATTKGFGSGPGPITKFIGKAVGSVAGGASHGPLGILVGHDLGGRAANILSKGTDAMTNALAERWLDRELGAAPVGAPMVNPASISQQPARISLAPLKHSGPTLPTRVPPGAMGTPFLDEISGEPVTQMGKGGFLPEEAPTNAGGKSPMVGNGLSDAQQELFHQLRYGAGAENRAARAALPDMSGETRNKALTDLANHTRTREADGGREFLLYRGDTVGSSDHQLTELSNWTPNRSVAQKFANIQHGGGEVHKAWIPEGQIKAVPRFWGARGSDLTEHEVWVKPSRSPAAPVGPAPDSSMDEYSDAIMGTGNHASSPMVGNLKADVIRDAKSYREGPAEPSGNPAANVEEQLGKTIKILDDLKAAKAAGTLTPKMTKAAVNAGISPKLVYRVTGDESIKGLPFSVKVIGRMKSGEPLTKAVSGASGEEE